MSLIIAIILFTVVSVAVWMQIQPSSSTNMITLPVLGSVSELVALLALSGAVIAITIAASFPLLIIFRMLDKTTNSLKSDESYKATLAEANNRQKALIKEYRQSQPPGAIPSHDRHGWTVISTALLMGLLFAFFGAAFSANFSDGASQAAYSGWFAISGIVLGFLGLNKARVQQSEQDEGKPISGNALWVIITGFAILVFGIGVMMWIRSQTG